MEVAPQQQKHPLPSPYHNNHPQTTATASNPNIPLSSAASSETKLTKHGTNRLRVKKACDRCKRQKSKCNGEVPCLTCSRHNRKCVYSQASSNPSGNGADNSGFNRDSFPARDESPAPADDDYTRYLENRVRELETIAAQRSFNTDDIEETFQKNMYTFSKDKYRVMRRYQNILPHELAKSVLNALDEVESKDLIVPRIQFYGWNMSGGHYLSQRTLPPMVHLIDLKEDLELGNWLVHFFMIKINPLFSILHEKVFLDQYGSYILNVQSADTSQTTRLFSAVLYLTFAISMRYAEHDPETPDYIKEKFLPNLEERMFDSAYEVVNKLSFEWQSCELIQSWILITLFLRTTYRQNASYMSLGNAIRMVKGMSLNLNIIPETLDKPYEWTKARRAFWLVYTWDRHQGFQSGKGYDILDKTIITPFPSLSEDIDDGWLSAPALAMINLARISGEIQNFVNGHFRKDTDFIEKISTQLNDWELWFRDNSKGYDELVVDQVYLTYHDIVLNFNNKVLFKLVERKYYPDDSHKQMETLIDHSAKVLQIFQRIESKGLLFIPWWLNLALLFNISLIDVTLINAGLHHTVCSSNLKEALRLLNLLEQKAHMAAECVWVLKMLNHMCVTRMSKSIKTLTDIGIDHGSGNVNKIKFLQFGKVDEAHAKNPKAKNKKRKLAQNKSTNSQPDSAAQESLFPLSNAQNPADQQFFQNDSNPDVFNLENVDSLLGNLKWFDQWVDEFDHQQN
jgi:hypothetical protein